MDRFLSVELGQMAGAAWTAALRPLCAYYRGIGICSFGCWEEPSCRTEEPEEGWHHQSYRLWIDLAETARACAKESRGNHRAVKELRDLARHAGRNAVRMLVVADG